MKYLSIKDYNMKKIVKLAESDLMNIIKRVINESVPISKSISPSTTPSKAPGCLGGMTYCATANQCCPAGACAGGECRDPRSGRRVPGSTPIDESEEMDENMYGIELDEVEGESEKKKGCCRPHYRCWSPYYQCVNCECVKAIRV
jgi:hypothetical protein